jgi:acetolactate synthase-1/2/3 large subunit
MKASDYIVDFLVKKGISHSYGYQGTMIAHLVDSIGSSDALMNHSCYNEQGAAFAAEGQAKTTGEVAFAYATSGPGAANLISGIADAYYDSTPVIFITGQLNSYEYLPVKGIKQHGFQEMDVVSAVRGVVKYCTKVEDVNSLRLVMEEAYYWATEGRPGPVLIDLPMDMQRYDIEPEALEGFVPPAKKSLENPDLVASEILDRIQKAERPILLLGNGISKNPEFRKKVIDLVDKLGIPVITSIFGRDILPYHNLHNFGFLGAAYGHRYANIIANKKTDLIVSLGTSLCKRQVGMKPLEFAEDAGIIRVDLDSIELQRVIHPDERSFLADCNAVVLSLIGQLDQNSIPPHTSWLQVCSEIKASLETFDSLCGERKPNTVLETISRHAQALKVICCDVGQHQMWCAQSYELQEGQRLLFSGGHGAMGFSLPAAIGAHYGANAPVGVVCGDGSFQMNIQELQLVFREQIPMTIFILNNNSLGLIQQQQDDLFEGRYHGSVAHGGYLSPDFKRIGDAYGISSHQITNNEELAALLDNLDYTKPNLIEIIIDTNSRAYPKTPFSEVMHNQKPYIPAELLEELLKK